MFGSCTGGACLITATISDSDSVRGTSAFAAGAAVPAAYPPDARLGMPPGPTTSGGAGLPNTGGWNGMSAEPVSETTGERSECGLVERLQGACSSPLTEPPAELAGLLPGLLLPEARRESGGKRGVSAGDGAEEPLPCWEAGERLVDV